MVCSNSQILESLISSARSCLSAWCYWRMKPNVMLGTLWMELSPLLSRKSAAYWFGLGSLHKARFSLPHCYIFLGMFLWSLNLPFWCKSKDILTCIFLQWANRSWVCMFQVREQHTHITILNWAPSASFLKWWDPPDVPFKLSISHLVWPMTFLWDFRQL